MKIKLAIALLGLGICAFAQAPAATASTADDEAAIKATALNYVEGWYEGSAERMSKALHPDLAKRIARVDKNTGKTEVRSMTAAQLIEAAGKGGGKNTPADQQRKDVKILDRFENMALVRADMAGWVDYMQIAKVDGEWKIINVLWQLRPKS